MKRSLIILCGLSMIASYSKASNDVPLFFMASTAVGFLANSAVPNSINANVVGVGMLGILGAYEYFKRTQETSQSSGSVVGQTVSQQPTVTTIRTTSTQPVEQANNTLNYIAILMGYLCGATLGNSTQKNCINLSRWMQANYGRLTASPSVESVIAA